MWIIHAAKNWRHVMAEAGARYMDCRQQAALKFPASATGTVQKRHILGYPVTGHPVEAWGGSSGRMPSQLRILVRRQAEQYTAFFLHLPHSLPKPWNPALGQEIKLWQTIHTHLDTHCQRLT